MPSRTAGLVSPGVPGIQVIINCTLAFERHVMASLVTTLGALTPTVVDVIPVTATPTM